MTGSEACSLVVTLTRQLAAARTEAATFRLIALTATSRSAELACRLEALRAKQRALRDELQRITAAAVWRAA